MTDKLHPFVHYSTAIDGGYDPMAIVYAAWLFRHMRAMSRKRSTSSSVL